MPDDKGGWVRPQSVDELTARLDARLSTANVKDRAGRNAPVLMRGIVANLSPEWFAENNPNWRENGLNDEARAAYEAMWDQAVEEYGRNLVTGSLHMDETTPQWQFAVTPVTDDGKLTQKLYWGTPSELRAKGVRMREAVKVTGIAVNMKPSARSTEHLSGDEFGRRADMLREREQEVEDMAAMLDVAKATVEARAADWAEPDADGDGEGFKHRRVREQAAQDGRAEGKAEAVEERRKAAQERAYAQQQRVHAEAALRRAESYREEMWQAKADWDAQVPTKAVLLDKWLDLSDPKGRTARMAFDAYANRVAQTWLAAHPEVVALDSDDLSVLVTLGTDGLDAALAEAQRNKGLR